jgi:hypothetical protein
LLPVDEAAILAVRAEIERFTVAWEAVAVGGAMELVL